MAFSLTAVLGINRKPFQDGLKQAEREASQAGKTVSSAFSILAGGAGGALGGAAGALGLGGAFAQMSATFQNMVQDAKRIRTAAEQTGLTVEEVQVMERMADRLGVSADKTTGFIQRLANAQEQYRKGIAESANDVGAKKLADAVTQMGLAVDNLDTKRVEDFYRTIQRRLQELGPAASTMEPIIRGMMVLGGKSGPALIPLLSRRAPKNLANIDSLEELIGVQASASAIREGSEAGKEFSESAAGLFGLTMGSIGNLFKRLAGGRIDQGRLKAGLGLFPGTALTMPMLNALNRPLEGQIADEVTQSRIDALSGRLARNKMLKEEERLRKEEAAERARLKALEEMNLDYVPDKPEKLSSLKTAMDSLARIGGFTQGAGALSQQNSAQNQTIQLLRSMDRSLKELTE